MSRYDTIGTHKTTVSRNNGMTAVTYHQTKVVCFSRESIFLNSGGYYTATTKVRMNQTASQFDLPYMVYQENFEWFVRLSHRGGFTDVPFDDNMEIILDGYGLARYYRLPKELPVKAY